MSANAQNYGFDEYDKPGAERTRRRRGEDDDLESDLEEELLQDDWLSVKKNPSEVSDEELNDDLLQSDNEDVNISGQDITLNASYRLGAPYGQPDNSQAADYTDDVVNLGAEGCEEGDVEVGGYQHGGEEEYTQEYSQDNNTEMPENQMDYTGEVAEGDDGYQDEVLDIQINEPIDGEFQDDEYQNYDERLGEHRVQREEIPEEQEAGGGEEQQQQQEEEQEEEEEDAAEGSRVIDTDEVENETVPEEETQEESDEEDEEDEESGRIRFKSERKDGAVVRLADAGSNRRSIPETLELSEKAKQDLMQFEEQERQKRQNRYGGRGMRGGRGRGGFPPFGMVDFRGGNRGRMIDHRIPLMGNMGMQPSSRMPLPHQQQLHSQQQHHPSRPRGPPPFQDHGRPLAQQPLQPLIPPHMAHRSPPLRPQMEPPPRMMSSPPPNFPQHHQQQPPQSKNIHINPHFRGPTSSSVQVPLMPPAQSQPRPAVGPQRFPGPGDFQQHMTGNFVQPQRPPHHMEPFRNQPPQGPQDREPLFMGERTESTRFPGQHMFDHQGPSPLMNSSHNLHHQQHQQQQQQQQQLPGQGHMGFGPPGPAFNQPGQGSLGIFPREPPRTNLPPHQGHQGMVGLNQQGGPPNQPRPFMGPRQPFGQQGNLFLPPQIQFGMQVRQRGLMHGPPVSQLSHHDSLPSHQSMHQQQQQQQQQHHNRQELPHHQQQHLNVNEPRHMMHHGQNLFHQQQAHGSPRQMTPRPQNPQQRNMANRQRMNVPLSKQMQQRNSNLRELPVAPGNANSARPAANIRPVAKATQGMRPGQHTQLVPDGGRGRGQAAAKIEPQLGGAGRTVVRKEIPSTLSSPAPQDPDEDEETRQYRLKIEEQKRLREEILKRKEMRRQMQAGVRKKELLDRLNAQTQSQGQSPSHIQPSQQNQLTPHLMQQPQPPQQQLQQQQQLQPLQQQQLRQQLQPQQQRQLPLRTQQSLNQSLKNPNQGTPIPPNGSPQIPTPRPNVKTRLQMVKGGAQQQQSPGPVPDQQWKLPPQIQQQLQQQQQQRRNSAVLNVNRPAAQIQSIQGPQQNIPVTPSVGPGQAQALTQGPKPGAKRTVMQRAKNSSFEGQQVPQKVRVVKLSGASGNGPVAAGDPVQQQGTWAATPLNPAGQRKVTMSGQQQQQQQAPSGTPQAGRGVTGNPQQNRVVVSGRGRGAGPAGRGRPMATRQSQRGTENERCTVSIEGLSSSTTDIQLQNLLRSIGPIEMFKMMHQQRKAVATFSSPQHAESFQMSFHRHMIDLSHIDVSLID
ncbi:RNA-binding protein 33 isoform X2 [Anarrhichthys ocellatus]|uniref:RNA-binding protein 33 isoform X2 n=1 Tax=Anarrhichthys ocellatus TaxID=433405 RepID=UPI0012ED900B|nr:RNA-binding protein 33 isoform X2 [Anarrhichthys ocellatus]